MCEITPLSFFRIALMASCCCAAGACQSDSDARQIAWSGGQGTATEGTRGSSDTTVDSGTEGDPPQDSDGDSNGDGNGNDPQGAGCDSMDLLFVIDNSESMMEEQKSLIESFPGFIQILNDYRNPNGEQIDYRIGVTTTGIARRFKETNGFTKDPSDTYDIWCESTKEVCVQDGVLQGQEKCGLENPWIESGSPTLQNDFACAAEVGIRGSWMEMPFGAIDLALGEQSEAGAPNEGFYRSGQSLLAVVLITDEDDCTVEEDGVLYTATENWIACDGTKGKGVYPVEGMKAYLDTVAGGEDRYVIVGIAGPGPKMCRSQYGIAKNALRIQQLVDICKNSVFGDICAGDLSASLEEALELITVTCDSMPPVV